MANYLVLYQWPAWYPWTSPDTEETLLSVRTFRGHFVPSLKVLVADIKRMSTLGESISKSSLSPATSTGPVVREVPLISMKGSLSDIAHPLAEVPSGPELQVNSSENSLTVGCFLS